MNGVINTEAVTLRESHPNAQLNAFLGQPNPTTFPIACLPGLLRRYAEEGARAVGVPVEMVALPLLVGAGATIGRHRSLVLKPGFQQIPVLFAAVVAPPGSAKSPAQSAALRPVRHLQHLAVEKYRRALQLHEADSGAGKTASRPALDNLYTTDATMEAIAPMLTVSPGLLVHFDELLAWTNGSNAYRSGKGADRQNWLSIWSCSPIKINRKTADPVYVSRPAVSVIGGIQPDVLGKLHDPSGGRDGFIERILWIFPDVQPALWTSATISERTLNEVLQLFGALRQPPADGSGVVELAHDALSIWIDWYNDNQLKLPHLYGLEAGYASKLPIQVARLALILHAASDPTCRQRMLAGQTMRDAIELGEYFRIQFSEVLPLITGRDVGHLKALKTTVSTILRNGGRWSRTDLHGALHGGTSAHDLSRALGELAAEGKVIKETDVGTRGRPPEYWRWVPESLPTAMVVSNLDDDVDF